ncbi:MAG: choice-of-anchor X domain-containing protein [Pseudomonadota bacterium]
MTKPFIQLIRTLTCAASIALCAQASFAATITTPTTKELYVQTLPTTSQYAKTGNALITATYNLSPWVNLKQRVPLSFDVIAEDQKLTLRDDGANGDEKAYDGIYSVVLNFDFDALVKIHQRYSDYQAKYGKAAIPLIFNQRQLVGRLSVPTVSAVLDAIKLGTRIPITPFGISIAIDSARSLMVRDPAVVQDPTRTFNACTNVGNPNGVWTFKHLVTAMANTPATGVTTQDFVRMWLSTWETNQTVNGWTSPSRNAGIHALIIDAWEAASGGPGSPLNLDIAPFQLLAIVNRVDLRENFTYGGGSAGEGRFVFQATDSACNPTSFTVIFEYGIQKSSCSTVKSWGQQWVNLSTLTLGSAAYNSALETITESFVAANAAPGKPNGSALNQLRTNEIALSAPWELREFVISASGWNAHFLTQNTVTQTSDTSLNNTLTLRNFVNSGATTVPLRFPTIANPFKGAASTVPTPSFFWNETGITPRQRRHDFSLGTCNGCHAGETGTFFTHVNPGPIPASLSGFLTGITVVDPADGSPTRTFNDLARRATDLDALVNSSCVAHIGLPPLLFSH